MSILILAPHCSQTSYNASLLKNEVQCILDFIEILDIQLDSVSQETAASLKTVIKINEFLSYNLSAYYDSHFFRNDDPLIFGRIIRRFERYEAKIAQILPIRTEIYNKKISY